MEYVITLDPKYVEDAKALELAENVYTKIDSYLKSWLNFFLKVAKWKIW